MDLLSEPIKYDLKLNPSPPRHRQVNLVNPFSLQFLSDLVKTPERSLKSGIMLGVIDKSLLMR